MNNTVLQLGGLKTHPNLKDTNMKTRLFFNKYFFLFFLLFTTFTIYSCSANEPTEDKSKKFGIYLFQDPNITWESLQGRTLDSLKLKQWITSDMIDFYDYSTHVIYLNVDYNTLLNFTHNDNTPFVVVANNKICYSGCFGSPKDTTQPCVTFTPLALCTDLVMLEFNPPQRKDIRVNDEVKSALTTLGKLKQGLSFNNSGIMFLLNSYGTYIKSYLQIMRPTCFKYEGDNVFPLYRNFNIIKVGSKQYLTKLVIYNQSSYYSLPSIITPQDTFYNKKPAIVDCENSSYFYSYFYSTDLSITLPISAWAGFKFPEDFKNGIYNCYVEFYGMMGGPKENRPYNPETPVRVWMGYQRTNTIQFEYDSSKDSSKCFTVLNTNLVLN
jgi:hypothetical protein